MTAPHPTRGRPALAAEQQAAFGYPLLGPRLRQSAPIKRRPEATRPCTKTCAIASAEALAAAGRHSPGAALVTTRRCIPSLRHPGCWRHPPRGRVRPAAWRYLLRGRAAITAATKDLPAATLRSASRRRAPLTAVLSGHPLADAARAPRARSLAFPGTLELRLTAAVLYCGAALGEERAVQTGSQRARIVTAHESGAGQGRQSRPAERADRTELGDPPSSRSVVLHRPVYRLRPPRAPRAAATELSPRCWSRTPQHDVDLGRIPCAPQQAVPG